MSISPASSRKVSACALLFSAAVLAGCGGSSSAPRSDDAPIPPGPSRCGDVAERPWCDRSLTPQARAELLLDRMTLLQKLQLMAGDNIIAAATGDPANGVVDGIPELGIPTIYMSDGPTGPREGQATAMPSPLSQASSFDPALAYRIGRTIATEVRFKGNDILHAPTVDVMRLPQAGRTFETFGEDPYLTSRFGVEWIRGAQSRGVIGNVKHYLMNTQEGLIGLPPITSVIGSRQLVNAIVDERTMREIYMPPFEAAVKEADVGSVMCAYNFVNGAAACGSRFLLQQVLRDDWGFDGFVVSDYVLAVKDTVLSVNNGTEIEMPLGMFYAPLLLQVSVLTGAIPMETIDVRVGNILRTLFRFGFFDRADFPADDSLIDQPAHAEVAREVAEQGTVLLKNDGTLPLDAGSLTKIAVIGEPATLRPSGGGSSAVDPFRFISPLDGITARAGSGVEVAYLDGSDAFAAAALAADADVALVFVADSATEGVDKTCLSLDCPPLLPGLPSSRPQDELVAAVSAANPRTVVVLQTAGPVLTPWRDGVAALLAAWYPGQEAGRALARVLFGDTDPGGRLPLTFPELEGDTPTAGNPAQYPGLLNQALYTEGVFIGYRWYDENAVVPAFPFGFGLSYTQFAVSDLQLQPRADGRVLAALTMRNQGSRAGWAVPQLYVGLPAPSEAVPQPPRALKGFAKQWLAPGRAQRFEFLLDARAFSYWDVGSAAWKIAEGCYAVEAGQSSRDLPLRATLARDVEGGWSVGGC